MLGNGFEIVTEHGRDLFGREHRPRQVHELDAILLTMPLFAYRLSLFFEELAADPRTLGRAMRMRCQSSAPVHAS